ncbi:MAG: hypothetical protein Q8O37_14240, partial [Sulfuricellaceae bacterium]|nr:hypothetical protein [Sulfuricellaceae bacterium]
KAELFWGRIGIRASTSSHFLRICFLITRIISNAYFVIRPVCAKFRLTVRPVFTQWIAVPQQSHLN